MSFYGWRPYVPVAQRRANALVQMEKLRKNGMEIFPIKKMQGRKIANTFWGKNWCNHLENFSDYENRLPRGRTYVRNGSVCHLAIEKGKVFSYVSGSDLYKVDISISTMPAGKWEYIRKGCTGHISSLLELLQGKLSDNVMKVVIDRDDGLFPLPGEITFKCSCPDWAVMCKHVAATLYGVGAQLDKNPELLFKLRGVDYEKLISSEAVAAAANAGKNSTRRRRIKGNVAEIFDMEIEEISEQKKKVKTKVKKRKKRQSQKNSVKTKKASSKTVDWLLNNLTGRRIKQIITASKLTNQEFATALGISITSVNKWIYKSKGRLNLQNRTILKFKDFGLKHKKIAAAVKKVVKLQ